MFGLENAAGVDGAALVIGIILVEAIVLYFGYALLERLVGPTIIAALVDE